MKPRWVQILNCMVITPPSEGTFTTLGRPVKASLMHQVGQFAIADLPAAQVLELPYGDGDLVMDIVLPKASLAIVEPLLTARPTWIAALRPCRVDVTLPKWKTTSALQGSQREIHKGWSSKRSGSRLGHWVGPARAC